MSKISRGSLIVLEARSARIGAARVMVDELLPRLKDRLLEAGMEVEIAAGPTRSLAQRRRRRNAYTRASAILHTGNRATFSRARRVVIVHDRLLLPFHGARPRSSLRLLVRERLLVHALRVADAIAVPTASMIEPIEELRRARGLPRADITVIPHGRPDWEPPQHREFHEPLRLLHVATVSWNRNFPVVARMMELLAERAIAVSLTATVPSDGVSGGKTLAEWFERSGERVRFVGALGRDDLRRAFAEHDVLVCPSHAEAFGQPLVEAMTMGMPIVASDRDWAREVCGGTASYADPSKPEQWADAVAAVGEGDPFNHAAIERSHAFDWDVAAGKYLDLLLG